MLLCIHVYFEGIYIVYTFKWTLFLDFLHTLTPTLDLLMCLRVQHNES